MNRQNQGPDRNVGAGYDLLTIAMTFALTLTGLILLGRWLDRRLGTSPWLMVGGALLGVLVGGYWGWVRLTGSRETRAENREPRAENRGPGVDEG